MKWKQTLRVRTCLGLLASALFAVTLGMGGLIASAAPASAASTTPPFTECPAVGADTSCAILIVLRDSGAQILTDSSQHVYDGNEDTLIGVLNNTTRTTITGVPLSSSTSAVFGFDGDGICSPNNPTAPFSPGPPGANSGVGPCAGNTKDTSNGGYGGPVSFFNNISGDQKSGTVNFINALTPGQSTFFSLEGAINGSDINIVSATASTISAVEGIPFNGAAARFHSTNTSTTASRYSATITWGDGSAATSGAISGGAGSFTVTGTHTYAEENDASQATITITDTKNGNTTTVQSPVTVADAVLAATGSPAFASANPVSGTLATFTDANPGATTADFTTGRGKVTVSWGDGTTSFCTTASTSPCTVTLTGTGHFAVNGTHTYAVLGSHTITISIVDDGGSTATATTRVIVFAFAHGGSFVIGDRNSAIGTKVTFWGAQWAKRNSLSGGPAPSSFKGFEGSVTAPVCGIRWTARPGNSAHPPKGPLPGFMGVIVSSSITKHGSKITGNTPHIVVVKTNPGYKPNPGHAGTGTVVAQVC